MGAVLEAAQGPVAATGSCLAQARCLSCPSSSSAVRPRAPPAPPPARGLGTALPRHQLPHSSAFYRNIHREPWGESGWAGRCPEPLTSLLPPPAFPPPAASQEKATRGWVFSSVPFRSRKGPCAARGRGAGPLLGTATERLRQLPPGDREPAAGRTSDEKGVLGSVPTLRAMQSRAEECVGF